LAINLSSPCGLSLKEDRDNSVAFRGVSVSVQSLDAIDDLIDILLWRCNSPFRFFLEAAKR
jgi:hypothetical protein